MRKVMKFGGATVGAGLVIGFGVVGWMYAHRSTAAAVSVSPGIVAVPGLNATASGTALPLDGASPTPTPGLAVVNDGNQGSVLGDASGSGSGGSNSGSSYGSDGATSTPNPLPGPSGFSIYDQYKGNATAMYIDVQPGTGAAVAAASAVTVQYRGWLTNGKEFDETYDKGTPFTFTENAGKVIPGFAEGMFGMKAGGERRIIVPPSQGYGDSAQGSIPADSVLVFDVVLVSVQ